MLGNIIIVMSLPLHGKHDQLYFIMQAKKVELPLPLAQLRHIFKIPILKAKCMEGLESFYEAVTSYGNMCLVIESESHGNEKSGHSWLKQRNKIMEGNRKCFPLVFQQHVVDHGNTTLCLTLIEDCEPLKLAIHRGLEPKLTNFNKLVFSLRLLEEQRLILGHKIEVNQLLYLNNSEQICCNFTQIKPSQNQPETSLTSYLPNLLAFMKQQLMPRYSKKQQIHQIIFIQGKIYAFEPAKLETASDYFQLIAFMNTSLDVEVSLIARSAKLGDEFSPAKVKKVKLRNLEDNPLIQVNKKRYSSLHFQDGKCINSLRQVFYPELSTHFIHENSLYKLQQFQHLIVHISKNFNSSSKNEQVITVYPPVNKVQLISFLIAYIKCIEPVMKSIEYLPFQNTLRLGFLNRRKEQKFLVMVFYEDYVVKDQEISMILEKSNLENCRLNLREMKISDSFLVFLSHIEKAREISELHLTDNYGLSDIGLSTFLKSPYSQNLETLSLSALNAENSLLEESLEIISNKLSLKKLYLKKYSMGSSIFSDEIDVSKLPLVELQSIGLKITLSSVMKGTLKILKIDQLVNIDELKNVKHLRLTELKIRLVESGKKSLMDSISSLSSLSSFSGNKNQSVRIFAEGQSKKTLKKLDISCSNCKFKTIRPILLIPQLEHSILDHCINLGQQFQPISPKILNASFSHLDINLQQMQTILSETRQLVELNLTNTKVGKFQIVKLLAGGGRKVHVENLVISELQYLNRLLEETGGYELIQSVELYVDRLLEPEQEYSFNSLLSKAANSSKTIRFILTLDSNPIRQQLQQKKQTLMSRINKYLIMTNCPLQSLSNLYTNRMKITELLEIQQNFQVQDSCESTVASSIAISTQRCRIISSPKIFLRKNSDIPILFKILQRETIDKFIHRFVKFMQENDKLVAVDFRGNKLIGKEAINVLLQYGRGLVREIDVRDCMFQVREVVDEMFLFQGLESFNDGHCEIYLGKEKFGERAQKYLKFFMRITNVNSLKIECEQIEDLQILYSVLAHILAHSSPTASTLSLTLRQTSLTKQSQHCLKTLFQMPHIRSFSFQLIDCPILDEGCSQYWRDGLAGFRDLEKLVLGLPGLDFPVVGGARLLQVSLQFLDGVAEEGAVNRCLRGLQNAKNLRDLRISLANNPNISNLNRVFSLLPMGYIFQKLPKLSQLSLNFEYCPLREPTLFQLLLCLTRLPHLKTLQLNISFAIQNFGDFVSCIEHIADEISQANTICIKIICVTENSNTYLLRTQGLGLKGIYFVL